MTDQLTFTDPVTRHPRIEPPTQHQPEPGLDADLVPTADIGATSYRGTGRLEGRAPSEDAANEVRLRWDAQRSSLADAVVRRLVATEDRNLDDGGQDVVDASSGEPVRKPRQGALSHNQIQRRADEAVKKNARGVADHLEATARTWRPDVLVLAGETQGRTAVRGALGADLAAIVQETDEGGLADAAVLRFEAPEELGSSELNG